MVKNYIITHNIVEDGDGFDEDMVSGFNATDSIARLCMNCVYEAVRSMPGIDTVSYIETDHNGMSFTYTTNDDVEYIFELKEDRR